MKCALPDLMTHPEPINSAARRELSRRGGQEYPTYEKPAMCSLTITQIKDRLAMRRRDAQLERSRLYERGKKPSDSVKKIAASAIRFYDLTGLKIGKFTVLGLHSFEFEQSRWVAQCSCGRYDLKCHEALVRIMRKYPQSTMRCNYCMFEDGIDSKLHVAIRQERGVGELQ